MSLPIDAGSWKLDTVHSQIGFAVRHLGISTIHGLFKTFDGSVVVDDDGATIIVSAEMASVETGNVGRDQHIQAADFFDTANHPQLTFTSSSVDVGAGTITGELTVKGVTNPIVLQATFNGTGVFPVDKSLHAGFSAAGCFNRSDFGVSYGVPMVSDNVDVSLEVQLIKQ